MLAENKAMNKNLKDMGTDTDISLMDISFSISYTKTPRLITALYMVTDIIDKDEPIRHKLRSLGTEIISDMHLIQQNYAGHIESAKASTKIAETVSFLDIASAMNFISEMNCAILKKEFLELQGSMQEYINKKSMWLTEFFRDSSSPDGWPKAGVNKLIAPFPKGHSEKKESNFKGHTRLGVQKGSTLLKALSDIKNTNKNNPAPYEAENFRLGFDILKKQRREDIINIIKNNGGNSTIKDIKEKTNTGAYRSLVCSEKTLQRELMSMTKDGVLKKTGEKRWSRYQLVNLPS